MAFTSVTYRYLCYSIQNTLKSVFSDAEISIPAILFWVIAAANKIGAARLNSGIHSGSYLAVFTDIPVKVQYTGANNILANKKYLELPSGIFDLDFDRGVHWLTYQTINPKTKVCTCEPVPFDRTTLRQLPELDCSPREKPTKDRPYLIRVRSILYLAGIEALPAGNIICNAGLYITTDPNFSTIALDDSVRLDDEDVKTIIESVLGLGRWALMVPKERSETGADERANTVQPYRRIPPEEGAQ